MNHEATVRKILGQVPGVDVIYLFGSQARGDARADSDVDIAVLAAEPLPVLTRYDLQEALASVLRIDVDLVDLRTASTVMRIKVIEDARVLYERDAAVRQRFEAIALSAYARLNEERRGILEDARSRGSIHG